MQRKHVKIITRLSYNWLNPYISAKLSDYHPLYDVPNGGGGGTRGWSKFESTLCIIYVRHHAAPANLPAGRSRSSRLLNQIPSSQRRMARPICFARRFMTSIFHLVDICTVFVLVFYHELTAKQKIIRSRVGRRRTSCAATPRRCAFWLMEKAKMSPYVRASRARCGIGRRPALVYTLGLAAAWRCFAY